VRPFGRNKGTIERRLSGRRLAGAADALGLGGGEGPLGSYPGTGQVLLGERELMPENTNMDPWPPGFPRSCRQDSQAP
jgi:hypothetical protein